MAGQIYFEDEHPPEASPGLQDSIYLFKKFVGHLK